MATSNALILTPGDPTGIGPEVTAKFLHQLFKQSTGNHQNYPELCVIGDIGEIQKQARFCGLPFIEHQNIAYIEVNARQPGAIAYESLIQAVQLIAEKKAGGLVTGPISKANLHAANIPYSGHTEILQDLANQYFPSGVKHQSDMLFVHQHFRMLLLTRHVALRDVSTALKPETVQQSLNSVLHFLKHQAGIHSPKLGILGVNPHAGEMQQKDGFCEERDILLPVLKALEAKWSIHIDPPLAADAAFRGFTPEKPPYDCYVAAYHDQGLIPMKLVAGMQAVNVTIGLPFIRTSVSHGTAPDIAGKGIADANALHAAFQLAQQLIQ